MEDNETGFSYSGRPFTDRQPMVGFYFRIYLYDDPEKKVMPICPRLKVCRKENNLKLNLPNIIYPAPIHFSYYLRFL